MNYYERHIGDYIKDTVSLSMLEDGAYNRLIDQAYQTEEPLPLEKKEIYRLARATSTAERKAVDYVLNKFWHETEVGYVQKRIETEIERYQDKQRKAKASADARWNKNKTQSESNANASQTHDANSMRSHSDGNAHQTPDTRHQTLKTEQSVNNLPSTNSPAADACIAIQGIYVQYKRPFTDISQANPIFQALVKAGATPDEFRDSAIAAMQYDPPKGFGWIVARVKGQRAEAATLPDLSKPPARNGSNAREAGRNIAASSIFTPETTRHLRGNPQQPRTEIEVTDEKL